MENCYKMYTWLCRTIVAVMLEMFWKMRQISDYFSEEESQETGKVSPLAGELAPLTKVSKLRRHIRSMSDVQSSTPWHEIPLKSARRYSQAYDSDSRTRRLRHRNRFLQGSDSSSDSRERSKPHTLEGNLKRFATSTDSMRYL